MNNEQEPSDDINDGSHDPRITAILNMLLGETGNSGIHAMPPVAEQPFVHLVRWRVMKIWDPGTTRHRSPYRVVIGHDGNEGRLSSAIQLLDLDAMRATTSSGRVYQLVDGPCWDGDAAWVFGRAAGHLRTSDSTRALLRVIDNRRAR